MRVKDKDFELFIDHRKIKSRVEEMGKMISEKYKDRNPLFIAVLNGSFIFASDLLREITFQSEISFIRVSSYVNLTSSGKVQEIMGLQDNIENREVILLEDIIDRGITIDFVIRQINEKKPASISVAAFLFKPEALQRNVDIDYIGFEIPDKFVVGYGLDYDGFGRNFKDIYQLKE